MRAIISACNSPAGETSCTIRYRTLDSLRGIAALAIVFHHCLMTLPASFRNEGVGLSQGLLTRPWTWFRLSPLWPFVCGRPAVIPFFVLSGFVLSLPFIDGSAPSYGRYLTKRFFRWYPPFAGVILASALLQTAIAPGWIESASRWFNQESWSAPPTAAARRRHRLRRGRLHAYRVVAQFGPCLSRSRRFSIALAGSNIIQSVSGALGYHPELGPSSERPSRLAYYSGDCGSVVSRRRACDVLLRRSPLHVVGALRVKSSARGYCVAATLSFHPQPDLSSGSFGGAFNSALTGHAPCPRLCRVGPIFTCQLNSEPTIRGFSRRGCALPSVFGAPRRGGGIPHRTASKYFLAAAASYIMLPIPAKVLSGP